MPVGRDGEVERLSVKGAEIRQFLYETHYASAQQRLASRNADFLDSQADENSRHAHIFGKRQFRVLRPLIACAAIHTLVVATIGDGDPEVGNRPSEFVGQAFHECGESRVSDVLGRKNPHAARQTALEGVSFPSMGGEGVSTFTLVPSGFEENRLRSHRYEDRLRRSETRRKLYALSSYWIAFLAVTLGRFTSLNTPRERLSRIA